MRVRAGCASKQAGFQSSWICALALVFLLPLGAAAGSAQKGEARRSVRGEVVDNSGNSVPSAVVYLQNSKTKETQTYTVGDDGEYHFEDLDPNLDYLLHAEKDDMISAIRVVSSYDSRLELDMPLRLNRKRTAH